MKKLIVMLMITLIFTANNLSVFASTDNLVTPNELEEVKEKYNIEVESLDYDDLGEDIKVLKLTKKELEELIIQLQQRNKAQYDFAQSVDYDANNVSNTFLGQIEATASNVVIGSRVLSRSHVPGDLQYLDSVSVAYQYEHIFLPGEPDQFKNYKFIATSSAGITNTNSSNCKIYGVSSYANMESSTLVMHTYSFTYELGFYLDVKGVPQWIKYHQSTCNGFSSYSISEVQ